MLVLPMVLLGVHFIPKPATRKPLITHSMSKVSWVEIGIFPLAWGLIGGSYSLLNLCMMSFSSPSSISIEYGVCTNWWRSHGASVLCNCTTCGHCCATNLCPCTLSRRRRTSHTTKTTTITDGAGIRVVILCYLYRDLKEYNSAFVIPFVFSSLFDLYSSFSSLPSPCS